ncbi:hypothetical protein A9O63_02095 [Cereibacter johrii]|uniref:Aminotransferase class III n=1 Tax=Cereibacter johrii TaxID=445629 RepID=A0ABX5JEN2_9RHOB|nr:hypothetical protein A9O63_02095 [Cereibacter johrii]PTM81548.1 aminotransferase class III [Cereibacter johrii]
MGRQTQIYADPALNAEIWDIEGRPYIDAAAGSAVVNTGHCHPKVMAAVFGQVGRFTHTCHQVPPCETCIRLAERLNAAVPGDFAKKTVFVTTGARIGGTSGGNPLGIAAAHAVLDVPREAGRAPCPLGRRGGGG